MVPIIWKEAALAEIADYIGVVAPSLTPENYNDADGHTRLYQVVRPDPQI